MVDLFTTQRGRRGGGRDGCGGLHRGFCFKILLRQSLVGIFPIRLSSKHTEDLGAFLEGSQPPWVMALSSTQGTQEAREDKTLWSTIVAHFSPGPWTGNGAHLGPFCQPGRRLCCWPSYTNGKWASSFFFFLSGLLFTHGVSATAYAYT